MTTIEANPAVPAPRDPENRTQSGPRRRPMRRHIPTALWIVGIVALTAIVLYPLLWMVSASFKPNSEFGSNQGFFPENPTIDNFVKEIGFTKLEAVVYCPYYFKFRSYS